MENDVTGACPNCGEVGTLKMIYYWDVEFREWLPDYEICSSCLQKFIVQ